MSGHDWLALALRLFGNVLSGHLIGAVLVYLVGLLVPVPMLVLGVAGAMLAYVPFLNLLAPAFCGLSFAHLMLESLRKERSGLPEGAGRAFPAHP